MDRQQIISKIRAMMALQEGSTFEGEASNAAAMIEKLCKKFGIDLQSDLSPQVYDEIYSEGRHRDYVKWIMNAVAKYYDAKLYIQDRTKLKVIGTEAQQIQVKLYGEFIIECMEKEAKKAYEGEKVLCELMGNPLPNRTFLHAFKQAFAQQVTTRLREMKVDKHEHAEITKGYLSTMRFGRARSSSTLRGGSGAAAGASAGEGVSLHRQAGGSNQRQLCGV
jgi:hypothetical protein